MSININIQQQSKPEEQTEQLICEHCKLPHSCTKEYKEKYNDKPWWCGLCYCAFMGITMRTECDEHAVPLFPKKPKPWFRAI